MAQREIIWTSQAQHEFANILSYFLERNQSNVYSLKLIDLVEHITKPLQKAHILVCKTKMTHQELSFLNDTLQFTILTNVKFQFSPFGMIGNNLIRS
jgi:hypothetical protein